MESRYGVDLYWLPLGAGGRSVRLNGRVFEAVAARRHKRPPCDLYHSALEVSVPDGRYVIEMTPIPDGDGAQRGVVAEGTVGTRWAGRFRVFRYELRRWRDGVIPDVADAVESPRQLTSDPLIAQRVLDLVPGVPTPVWGRDELATGEMWNSNSLIAWLIVRSGLDPRTIRLPSGGRAPGWNAGLVVARRQHANQYLPEERVHGSTDAALTALRDPSGMERDPGPIVVGTDGSAPAKAALTEAIRLARTGGRSLVIVTAWRELRGDFGLPYAAVIRPLALAEIEQGWADETLAEAAAEAARAGVKAETVRRHGNAVAAICAIARERNADLIVLGTRGLGTAEGLVFGSVASGVLAKASCAVLVVPKPATSRGGGRQDERRQGSPPERASFATGRATTRNSLVRFARRLGQERGEPADRSFGG